MRTIELTSIPARWWFKKPSELFCDESIAATEDALSDYDKEDTGNLNVIQEPWMKYVAKIERMFRSFNNHHKKTRHFMSVLDTILDTIELD